MSLYCFGSDIAALLIIEGFDTDTADEDVIEAASRRVDGLFGFDDFFPARVSSTNRISLGEWVLDWDEAITVDGYDNRYTVPYRSTEGAAHAGGGGGGGTTLGLRFVGWSDDQTIETADLDESMAEVDAERSNSIVIPDRSANGYLWYAVPAAATGPTMIMITDNFIAPDFVEQAGTVQDADGNEYRVAVTHNLLSGSLNSGETLEFIGLSAGGSGGGTPIDPDTIDVSGLEFVVWGYPQRWRVVAADDSTLTAELATPIAFVERGQAIDFQTGIRGPGYVRPLGERLVNWGTPSVVARATTYFAVASTYRLQGTADQKLATAAEAEARKMLGMRASDIRPSVRPWVGWPGRRATSQVEAV